jgi:hypothetical protein
MLSSTYQQASRFPDQRAEETDPENRYLWRMNRVRLEGEAIWDAIHAVAGTLNPAMGGRSVAPPLAQDEQAGSGGGSQWPVNADTAEHNRRGIYILSRPNFTYPMLAAFDSPENAVSCPERDVTTVAPQALWALNNHVMFEQAVQLAGRLVKETGNDPARWVKRAWDLAVGRPATDKEMGDSLALIGSLARRSASSKLPPLPESLSGIAPERASGLAKFCPALFNLNEFLYVD